MSADNGIYILKTSDQYRVIHAQAIENLYWSHIKPYNKELVSTRVIEYYGNSKYTRSEETALKIANYMAKDTSILEYGIVTISTCKTWNQIIREAKELAPLELESIKNKSKDDRWKYDITNLENIINSL